MTHRFESRIQDILNRFEWDRVQTVMTALNWGWVGRQPSLADLKSTAHWLLNRAVELYNKNPRDQVVSTGGLVARITVFTEGPQIELEFVVASTMGVA